MSAAEPLEAFEPRRRTRPRPVEPPPSPPAPAFNWSAIGVMLALAVHFAAVVALISGMDRRLGGVEEDTAPLRNGQLARIDERTLAIQTDVADIKRRLDGLSR